ncbi:helix-turn-helix domain-containing transcriptional regulator [Streptomyces swartbergensis]|uniref:helix-turn-helix domain-containing transcriptional regulator n=1 Tax=Streptomyces swartbergensis TaxID=487165 RepID=UPI003825C656
MSVDRSVFWDDLAEDLKDPQFRREYVLESLRIETIDRLINALDDAREAAKVSKAELARAIGAEPATVRRLLSAGRVNPTLGTLSEVAAALGLRISIEPLPPDDEQQVVASLRGVGSVDTQTLAAYLEGIRDKGSTDPALT